MITFVKKKGSLVQESTVFGPVYTHNKSPQAMRLVSKDFHLICFLRKQLKTLLFQNSILELKLLLYRNVFILSQKVSEQASDLFQSQNIRSLQKSTRHYQFKTQKKAKGKHCIKAQMSKCQTL